jgi:putative phosphoserine phosphatase/1-acylglycerol-3-phosphate O-acyltransferase
VEVLPPVDTSTWKAETVNEHVREVRNMFARVLGQPEAPSKKKPTSRRKTTTTRAKTKTASKSKAKPKAKAKAKAKAKSRPKAKSKSNK